MGKFKRTSTSSRSMRRHGRYLLEDDIPLCRTLPNTLTKPTKYTVSMHSYLYLQWLKVGALVLGGTPDQDEKDDTCLMEVMKRLKHVKSGQRHQPDVCPRRQTQLPETEVKEVKKCGDVCESGGPFGTQCSLRRLNWKPVILGSYRVKSAYGGNINRQYNQRPRALKLHQGGNSTQTCTEDHQPQSQSLLHPQFNPCTKLICTEEDQTWSQSALHLDFSSSKYVNSSVRKIPPPVTGVECNYISMGGGGSEMDTIAEFKTINSTVGDSEADLTASHSVMPKFTLMQISGNSQSFMTRGTSPKKFKRLDDLSEVAFHSQAKNNTRDPMWCQSMPISPSYKILKGKRFDASISRSLMANSTNHNNDDSHAQLDSTMISESGSPLRDVLDMNLFSSSPANKSMHCGSGSNLHSVTNVFDHHGCLGVPEVSYQSLISPWNTRKFIPWSPSHLFVRAKELPRVGSMERICSCSLLHTFKVSV